MFFMQAMAADAASPDQNQSNAMRVWLFSAIVGIVAAIIGLLLIRSANLFLAIAGAVITGIGPILGYALATGSIGSSIVALILGALSMPLGFGVLSAVIWPILVGAASRVHSIGTLLLWSIIGDIAGLAAAFLILPAMMGQDPNWLQTAFVVWAIIWSLGTGYGLSKTK